MVKSLFRSALPVLAVSAALATEASPPETSAWVAELPTKYWVAANQTYLAVDGFESKLDVFVPGSAAAPVPAVIFFHGGGWTGGDKAVVVLRLMPYLEMGWAAVNVNYRLGLAPAAVEDCRCALRWVIQNAEKYHIDVTRLVVTGESAGSHLALTTGMLPASAGLDSRCPGPEELKVAAIVNWYGVTDVADVLDGANQQPYAVQWFVGLPNRIEVARRVSPLQYARPGLPPVLSIHGDADQVAPYGHAVRLHDALDKAKVPNQLFTIRGGNHGGFTRDQFIGIYVTLRAFLEKHVIAPLSR